MTENQDIQPTSPSKSSLQEQFGELAIKGIMVGGVGVGGFGAFWSLFVASDVPKAIASGLSGIMISYGASLLKPLHEGNQQRFGKAGQWINRQVDDRLEALNWKRKDCDGKYLERQGERCREYYGIDVEDFKQPEGILQVNLDEVFVPLNLDVSMGGMARGLDEAEKEKTWEIWDFLAQAEQIPSYRWISILADGGSGKTTLLRHIGHELAQGRHRKHRSPKRLPFVLYLRKWRDEIANDPTMRLPELMEKHVRSLRDGASLVLPPRWAVDQLRSGKALIMFDGYDEVAKGQRQVVAEWISAQVAEYSRAVFVLTSRPSGYDDFKTYAAEVPTTLRVREFEKEERDIFVQKWYLSQERLFRLNKLTAAARSDAEQKALDLIEQIDESEELQRMAANPLQLNLIARVHKFANGAPLPTQKTKLYQEIFDLQLGARPLAKRVEMVMDTPKERQRVLQAVALTMLRENVVQVDRSQLLDWIRSALTAMDEQIDAEAFLSQVDKVAELLYEADSEEFAFSHLSFRNYLAALECDRLKNWDEVAQNFGIDGWREMILMLSGRLKPVVLNQLVGKAIEASLEHVYLAYDCLVRYPVQGKIDRAWIDGLQPLRYEKLERQMRAGEWREADRETYRLMIQTCGKDFGDGVNVKDLKEFPCWDLKRIDQLWVSNSNERFGFSVQKKLWEACGSPGPNYSGENKEKWDDFWEAVGWRSKGGTFDYDKLCFDPIHSPAGELPIGSAGDGWRWVFSFLAHRLVNCSTRQS
jgi:hypothetical protein